jgi:ribonuclease Z
MSQMVAEAGEDMDNNLTSITEDIQESHIKPEEAAFVAKEAGVPVLIITHVLPPVPDFLRKPFLREAKAIYDGHLQMANDGTLISLPANSDGYSIHELLA